ncbi:MAG TPA: tRNA (N6-isopentenyl adenosine(37)-C2)-methylthiotransferase MiaB, partial [Bacteroidales bacterium]|nr:tRNA (N6-isopentenyl adenosine(37)-C2)-methylthiotransferase MiaB [Bacteroidales bacterium]
MKKSKLYIETYGCQMNIVDSEVVASILTRADYEMTDDPSMADLILLNTCSIRENAEQRIRGRLDNLAHYKKGSPGLIMGVIGCMAERVKDKLLEEEKVVDLVVGPDAYRDLPRLINAAGHGEKGVNTLLSLEETYGDISPVRLDKNHVSAFISIMRGCNNMCAYCVVPYTRGRERSRDPQTILHEVSEIIDAGYHEVTLLGQNVDSYNWSDSINDQEADFPSLLRNVARLDPRLRVRFSTSHPKDMSDNVLETIARYPNICKSIHLPVQSGSDAVLSRMKRRYTRADYLDRIRAIREIIPAASVSTDIIAGFCGETEDDHQATLSLMEDTGFDFSFMFKYSERPGTLAARKYADDVPEETKTRRLNEIIELQNHLSLESKKKDLGKHFEVLTEGFSKKSDLHLFGRTTQNKVVVFPASGYHPGDYVTIGVEDCTSATLLGKPIKST